LKTADKESQSLKAAREQAVPNLAEIKGQWYCITYKVELLIVDEFTEDDEVPKLKHQIIYEGGNEEACKTEYVEAYSMCAEEAESAPYLTICLMPLMTGGVGAKTFVLLAPENMDTDMDAFREFNEELCDSVRANVTDQIKRRVKLYQMIRTGDMDENKWIKNKIRLLKSLLPMDNLVSSLEVRSLTAGQIATLARTYMSANDYLRGRIISFLSRLHYVEEVSLLKRGFGECLCYEEADDHVAGLAEQAKDLKLCLSILRDERKLPASGMKDWYEKELIQLTRRCSLLQEEASWLLNSYYDHEKKFFQKPIVRRETTINADDDDD